jgi:hypothetical protein
MAGLKSFCVDHVCRLVPNAVNRCHIMTTVMWFYFTVTPAGDAHKMLVKTIQ